MRAFMIAVLIFVGIGVLTWATAGPNDGRANAEATFPKPAVDAPLAPAKAQETAVVAGGCFWGIQAVFAHLKGVVSSTSGYSGGAANTAHYEDVSTGATGHAESVKIVFDPSQISYGQILMIFFSVAHNPTELNFQGPDYGTQYRSSIFYSNDQQKKIADAYIAQLNDQRDALSARRSAARAGQGQAGRRQGRARTRFGSRGQGAAGAPAWTRSSGWRARGYTRPARRRAPASASAPRPR